MFMQGGWLNPPETWSADGAQLRVTTDANTDFWRKTSYGFIRDSGHFFGMPVDGDFTAQLHVAAQGVIRVQYSTAGTRWPGGSLFAVFHRSGAAKRLARFKLDQAAHVSCRWRHSRLPSGVFSYTTVDRRSVFSAPGSDWNSR